MISDKTNTPSHTSMHQPGEFGAQAKNRSEFVQSVLREQEQEKRDNAIDARRERLRAAGRKGAAARTHESRVNGGKKAAQTRGFASLSAAGKKGAQARLRTGQQAGNMKRAAEKYKYPTINVTRDETQIPTEEQE